MYLDFYKGVNIMKNKLTIILILCFICIVLCACNATNEVNHSSIANNESIQNNETQNDTTQNNATQNAVTQNDATQNGEMQSAQSEKDTNDFSGEVDTPIIEVELLTISSKEEYVDFLNSNQLPADFVSYDKISAIGNFKGLVILSDAYSNDYSSYMYNLVDSSGFEFVVYIDHEERESYLTDFVSNVNKTDMRVLSDDSKGFYVYNDITYKYISGKISSIVWKSQNIIYTLFGGAKFFNYPLTDSTFIGKMLNTNTALQVLNEVFTEV